MVQLWNSTFDLHIQKSEFFILEYVDKDNTISCECGVAHPSEYDECPSCGKKRVNEL